MWRLSPVASQVKTFRKCSLKCKSMGRETQPLISLLEVDAAIEKCCCDIWNTRLCTRLCSVGIPPPVQTKGACQTFDRIITTELQVKSSGYLDWRHRIVPLQVTPCRRHQWTNKCTYLCDSFLEKAEARIGPVHVRTQPIQRLPGCKTAAAWRMLCGCTRLT